MEGNADLRTKAAVQAEPARRSRLRPEDIGFGRRFVAATYFGSVLNPVNSSIIAVALVPIGHAFGVGASATTWLVSALYLAAAIGQPTMGRLADLGGPRRVYLAGTAAVAVGGLLIAAGGWRLTFLINVPLAIVGAVAILAWLPANGQRVRLARAWHELDPRGLVLFAAALTGLLLFLMSLASPRWWLLAVTAVLLGVLTACELRVRTPFLDVRMLARNRALTTTYVRFGITMLITYGFIYGWTPWLEQSAGLSAAGAGLVMVPSFVVAAVVSALAARHSRVWPLLVAGATACVTLEPSRPATCVLYYLAGHERQSLWPPGSLPAAQLASGGRSPRQSWTAARPSS